MKETVHSLLADSLRRFRDSEAILAVGRRSLTYGDLGRQLAHDHAFLRSKGFGQRSRIGVAMPAGPAGLVMLLAAAASAVCAPLDPDLEVEVLERLMVAMRIECLVVSEGSTSHAVRAAQALGIPLVVLLARAGEPAGSHGLTSDLHKKADPTEWPRPDDLAFLWHTSGTTGVPKVVPYEQWRICSTSRARANRRNMSAADRMLIIVPLSSSVVVRTGLLPHLSVGASLICAGAVSGESLPRILEELSPTVLYGPPGVHSRLVEMVETCGGMHHRLRAIYSSFAELPPSLRARGIGPCGSRRGRLRHVRSWHHCRKPALAGQRARRICGAAGSGGRHCRREGEPAQPGSGGRSLGSWTGGDRGL